MCAKSKLLELKKHSQIDLSRMAKHINLQIHKLNLSLPSHRMHQSLFRQSSAPIPYPEITFISHQKAPYQKDCSNITAKLSQQHNHSNKLYWAQLQKSSKLSTKFPHQNYQQKNIATGCSRAFYLLAAISELYSDDEFLSDCVHNRMRCKFISATFAENKRLLISV